MASSKVLYQLADTLYARVKVNKAGLLMITPEAMVWGGPGGSLLKFTPLIKYTNLQSDSVLVLEKLMGPLWIACAFTDEISAVLVIDRRNLSDEYRLANMPQAYKMFVEASVKQYFLDKSNSWQILKAS